MKAMVIRGFGGPEVFEQVELPTPEPGAGEVRVRVRATSVNPVDYKIRKSGSWARLTLPAVIGYDVAGVVDKAGPGVRWLKPGDEVFYTPRLFGRQGSYAEYHVEDELFVAPKPPKLGFEEAASLPLAGCTALDAIRFMRIQPGQTVLIHAAAGGVGSLAVQMACASGARVIGTCRGSNMDFVKSLGAWEVIDYRSEDFVSAVQRMTGGEGVDAVYDTVGGDTIARSIGIARPRGRIASIVNTTGDLGPAYRKNILVYFSFLERERQKLDVLRAMLEHAKLRPVIDSVLPLSKVAEAHRKLEQGGVRGKIVLKVGE